jgi:hypothetical protein
MVKRELALRVSFGVEDGLHASLQLDEDYLDISRGFSRRAILYRAVGSRAVDN